MAVQLNQRDIADLKAKGFSDRDINEAVKELNAEDSSGYSNSNFSERNDYNRSSPSSFSSFGSRQSDDIAKWQLELNDILEKVEHALNGDIIVLENGELVWKENPDPENNTFNKFGVQICMKFLSLYVNRNTILADYTEEEVRYKVLDFGKGFNDLIFKKYDEMGMDNEEKRKEYDAIVRSMVDVVHSSYARAKDGRERESYRRMVTVSQATNGMTDGSGVTVNTNQSQKARGLLNPMRYIGGKYV